MSERLKEMRKKLDDIKHVFFITENTVQVSREIYFWLEEQAELVEELIEELSNWQVFHKKDTIKLDEQNKRYREALGRLQRAINRYPTEDLPHVIKKVTEEALEDSQ